jgi:hypothetical protein
MESEIKKERILKLIKNAEYALHAYKNKHEPKYIYELFLTVQELKNLIIIWKKK